MNAKKTLMIILMMLFPAFTGFAADSTFEGDATLLGEHANIDGNKAKFGEYRDIRSNGLYGGFDFNYDSKDPFLHGTASDIGYDTQQYRLDGGRYGKFHYFLDYNEIPHNLTYDAKTFYSDPGSNNLNSSMPPPTDTSTWSTFDYAIKRKTGQGGFRLDYLRPFYFDVSASREERTGIKPTGVAASTPGGIAIELPEPIDYTTDTVKFEAGYGKKPVFAAINFVYSNFNNKNSALFFNNPSGPQPNTDAINLAPDNQYYKLAFKGSVQLPLNSRFNVNLSSSRTTSEANLFTSYVTTVNVPPVTPFVIPITVSDSIFNGKIDTRNYNFVLTSNPAPFFTGKVYYKYYNRQNNSDQITTSDPNFNAGTPFVNTLFEYRKNSYGIELGFRMPAQFSLQTAYSYLQTDRARGDFPETRDHTYSVELKWSGLDFIVPKVAYERLQRGADHGVLTKETAADQITENTIEPFIGRFDAGSQDRDTFKASVEVYPLNDLSFDVGYRYKKVDYKDTVLGLRNHRINEVYVDAGYSIGQIAQLNAYGSYEKNKTYQFQRSFVTAADPSTQDATNYNWDVVMKDDSFSYGANAELFIVPQKVTLVLQYDDIKSNGRADFTYYSAAALAAPLDGRTNDTVDIGAWDDYTLRAISAKIQYFPSKTYTLSAGYAYERYTYNDASWDNYDYVPATTTTNGAYLTGAYANPNYHANVVFFAASYRF